MRLEPEWSPIGILLEPIPGARSRIFRSSLSLVPTYFHLIVKVLRRILQQQRDIIFADLFFSNKNHKLMSKMLLINFLLNLLFYKLLFNSCTLVCVAYKQQRHHHSSFSLSPSSRTNYKYKSLTLKRWHFTLNYYL